jgi:type II secretory pathway pseudopilin PulG
MGINKTNKYNGFSLLEIIIALGIFIVILASLSMTSVDSLRAISNSEDKNEAYMQMSEIIGLLIQTKENDWTSVIVNTDGTPKHLDITGGEVVISDGTRVKNDVTSWIEINDLSRDVSGDVVFSGGTLDPYSRIITMYMQWTDPLGNDNYLAKDMYINDWNTAKWLSTTTADFDLGTHDYTKTTTEGDGEVSLATIFYPDWCNPTVTLSEYDIPGSAESRSIFARPDHAYLGTRGETGGEPFTKLNISGVTPPVLTVEGTFDGYTVNDIFVEGDYAFLATTNNSKEVLILDVSSVPYTEVGYYDASGSTDAYSVFIDGDVGYVAQGRYIRSFDTSSYVGARSSIGSERTGWWFANISQIYGVDDYLFLVLNNDWYELTIMDISNPADMTVTSQTSVNNQQVLDMYVNDDGTRVYFGTNASGTEDEFFILDTTSKSGARPVIASLDTGGTSIKGIAVVEDENIGILVGTSGEEYQVYNMMDKQAPFRCGGMHVNSGIYDVDSNLDGEGNAFSYIVSGDTSAEFKIMRGGAGGGNGTGYGYTDAGEYTSAVFDTTNTDSIYYYMSWMETTTAVTDIQVQVRSSNLSNMSGAVWVGPDGTSGTFYTDIAGGILPNILNSNRYLQFRAYLTGDTNETPYLEEVSIIYKN